MKLKNIVLPLTVAVSAFSLCQAKASKGNAKGEKDYLLILGCRVRGDKAEETLKMRCEKAAEYLKKHKSTVAIACGGIVHKDQFKSEAEVISEILEQNGIEKERIILEDKSKTTAENFINAKALTGNADSKSIAFLSSEFHLLRAGILAKSCGLKVETVAAPSPQKEKVKNYIREFFCLPMMLINIEKGEKKNG